MPDPPYRVDKPWGYELIWARTERYAGKILHVNAGHVLSCQYHNLKDETMHVLTGELILRLGDGPGMEERRFRAGESVRDRKSTRLNSSHIQKSRMPSSA